MTEEVHFKPYKRYPTRGILALFAIAVLLRLLSLKPLIIDVDEAWFSASAAALTNPFHFFNQALDNKPPGTVWFYWIINFFLGNGADPRPARLVYLLLLLWSAWQVGRTLTLLKKPHAGWIGALCFFLASALPEPELLATTTEGLMTPLLCFAMLTWFQGQKRVEQLERWRLVFTGACIGALILLKPTAILFFPALAYGAYAAYKRKTLSKSGAWLLLSAACAVAAGGIAVSGASQYWFWSIRYPSSILLQVRESLFSGMGMPIGRSFIYLLFLFPLVVTFISRKAWRTRRSQQRSRTLLALWFAGALAAVAIGKAAFFHYFLYLAAPLAILWGWAQSSHTKSSRRYTLIWLSAAHALVCFIAISESASAFWGTDLTYYERLGQRIQDFTPRHEKILIWGGTAVPYVTSARKPALGFITSRFVTYPYATPETARAFRRRFEQERPPLFVDLHERADNGFNVPLSADPWLAQELKRNYVSCHDPTLPWTTFYRNKKHSPPESKRSWCSSTSLARQFEPLRQEFYFTLQETFLKPGFQTRFASATRFVKHIKTVLALELLLRDWNSLEALMEMGQSFSKNSLVRATYLQLKKAIRRQTWILKNSEAATTFNDAERDRLFAQKTANWLFHEFQSHGMSLPLSLHSRAWWVSLALVKLQPGVWPHCCQQ